MTPDLRPDDDLRQLLATPQGRSVLWQILSWTGVHQTPFTGDLAGTSFKCGEQNIGQRLTGWILETAPSAYANMYQERSDEPNHRNANTERSGTARDPEPGSYGYDDEPSLVEQYPVPGRNTEGSGEL